jgi:NADH dehydrogenase/NADH:ubiquinone oxidoreductase subunit G
MEQKKVKVIVNGAEMQLPEGQPLLQALIDEKIEVPHFCYHPGIGIEGSCRLCLVEVVGQPKLATSCTVFVKEGMQVNTHTPVVDKARKGVLEFFLINHPLDCPFCDKGGECPLQNYTLDAQQDGSRYEFEKEAKDKHQSIGDHIMLDKERCVLCNRCVRFGRNLSGHEELSIQNRGHHAEIFIPEGTKLTNGFTGNLADICPVGALTTKEFRFQARPWEMKTVDSLCGCSIGCNVEIWKKDQKLLRLTPRINPDVNEWWLSDKCRFSIHGFVKDEDRITQPINNSLPMNENDWVSRFTQDIKKSSGKLAFVCTSDASNEEFFTLKTLARILKSKVYAPVSNEVRKIKNFIDSNNLAGQFPESLESSDNVVVVGRLEEDHSVLALRVRRLHHAFKKNIVTLGDKKSEFKDIYAKHIPSTADSLSKDFESLKLSGSTTVLLSYRWITDKTVASIQQWLGNLPKDVKVFFLLEGANAQGMIDQWDETLVFSHQDLDKDIQNGKIQGLFQLGVTPVVANLKGVWMAHAVYGATQASGAASWILPLEYFTEKSGTYTNTFGNVQRLHRSRRIFVSKAFDTLKMLEAVLQELGQKTTKELSSVYANLAKDLNGYPKAITDIVEQTKTYTHYERAQWR